MRGAIVEADPVLRVPHGVGKGPTTGDDHDTACAGRERADPMAQDLRESKTAAEFDNHRHVAAFGSADTVAGKS